MPAQQTGLLLACLLVTSTATAAAQAVPVGSVATIAKEQGPARDLQLDTAAVVVAARLPPARIDIRALVLDPAIRNFIGLSENSWDFTAPGGVPGFGPLPGGDHRDQIVLSAHGDGTVAPRP